MKPKKGCYIVLHDKTINSFQSAMNTNDFKAIMQSKGYGRISAKRMTRWIPEEEFKIDFLLINREMWLSDSNFKVITKKNIPKTILKMLTLKESLNKEKDSKKKLDIRNEIVELRRGV